MTIETILQEIGLTSKEAAVYLAALELGQASALRIAQKSGVKRPTAYVTLNTLRDKGLIEVIPKGTTTAYQAMDPEKILLDFEEKIAGLKTALPELKSLHNIVPGKPRVRFYEGRKSITALYAKEIFNAHDILALVDIRTLRSMMSREELEGLIYGMKATGSTIREFVEDSPEAREYLAEKNRLGLGETKFLPPDAHFNVDILVYGHTVAMIAPKTLIAVVIEDAAISNAQRQFLEFLWKSRISY